jgi:polyisoprenoid-binding protein YceI
MNVDQQGLNTVTLSSAVLNKTKINRTVFTGIVALFISFSAFMSTAKAANPLSEIPSGEYTLDKSHASIVWTISHLGLSQYVARFTEFDINLNLDVDNIAKSSVTATVNPASVSTENVKFDKDLAGKGWLKSEKFPQITFASSEYKPLTDTTGKLMGSLTLLGIAKQVEFDVTIGGTVDNHPFIADAAGVGFSAMTVIKRSDWGFSKFIPTVGDEVTLKITAEFFKNTQ